LEIIISNASGLPIYEQITVQIKNLILSGSIAEGEQLPSIRSLASDLRLSVITTKRAYTDLENQGFIETVPGKGSFVAGGNLELLREERLRRVEKLLNEAITEARGSGITGPELHEMLNVLEEGR
jgi:GntR family transcriptional regulator